MSTCKLYGGIDIGGSHIGFELYDDQIDAVFDSNTEIDSQTILPQTIISLLQTIITNGLNHLRKSNPSDSFSLKSIGIGCPGWSRNGVLVAASNFPNLKNFPISSLLQACIDVPVVLLNDADAAISAEIWGNPTRYQNFQNVAMITLGTGVGFSLILGNKLYQGSHGLIEGGHSIVSDKRSCGCGQVGCVEVFASAKNASLRLMELDNNKSDSLVNGKEIFERFSSHESNAIKVIEEV